MSKDIKQENPSFGAEGGKNSKPTKQPTTMKLFAVAHHEKCGSCNWERTNLYLMSDSKERAIKERETLGSGLCADCMCELLMNYGYEITHPEGEVEE